MRCFICNFNFQTPSHLKDHLKFYHYLHHKGYAASCVECTRSFSSYVTLINHYPRCQGQGDQYLQDEVQVNDESLHAPTPMAEGPDDNSDADSITDSDYDSISGGIEDFIAADFDNSIDSLQKQAAQFTAYLYSRLSVPRNAVQDVVEGVSVIFDSVAKILQTKLSNHLSEEVMLGEITPFLTAISQPFELLKSEHLRFEYFRNLGTYVPPEEITIGERDDKKISGSEVKDVTVKVTCQYISPKQIFQKFFDQEDVLETVLNYHSKLLTDKSVISNIIQGKYWTDYLVGKEHKTIFPVFIYMDEFETGNVLGSHSGIHKLTGVYLLLSSIPPEFRYALKNIFLTILFHSDDRKTCGNEVIFYKLIADFNDLCVNGLSFKYGAGTKKIHFQLVVLAGDNLSVHIAGGFNESFMSNFPCIICMVDRITMHSQTEEDESLIRNRDDYDKHVDNIEPSKTGIKATCCFNQALNFHITENVAVDPMHDLLEGIAHYDFGEILYNFIYVKKYFTLEDFNSILLNFNYGLIGSENKPPLQTESDIKSKKIRMSASETLTFLEFFGVMFSSFIPDTDEFWQLGSCLRNVTSLVLSRKLQPGCKHLLKSLIRQHHEMYLSCTGSHLKNKFHHVNHYPRFLELFGNLYDLWCMRFEAKHRISKIAASAVCTRKNLCKTVAVRHQLLFNWHLISKEFFDRKLKFGRGSHFSLKNLLRSEQVEEAPDDKDEFYLVKSVEVFGTTYKPGMVLCYDHGDMRPKFGVINKVLVFNSKTVHFIVRKLEILYYDTHSSAFLVENTDSSIFLNHNDLCVPQALSLLTGNDGNLYVASFGIFE